MFTPIEFLTRWPVENGEGYVAVDNSGGPSNGRVYVAKSYEGEVLSFTPNHIPVEFSASASYISGNTITGTPSGHFGTISNISVGNEGNIYVVEERNLVVDEFAPSGEFITDFSGTGVPGGFVEPLTGVAIDPTNENVLVVDSGNQTVDEFSTTGEYLGQLTGTDPSTPFGTLNGGIAVNSHGYLYVADGTGKAVDIFKPTPALPKVVYGAVSNQGHTSGTLNATIEPRGSLPITGCHFEYGTNTNYGLGSLPCSPDPTSMSTGQATVSASISGLTTGTTYHYRIVISDENGTAAVRDRTYTPQAVNELITGNATNPTAGGETLHGSFDGDGTDTHYYFEYGTTIAYGQTTSPPPGADAGSGSGTQEVSVPVSGFLPNTVYHYRIVAVNGSGTDYGADQRFISASPNLPAIKETFSSAITTEGATLDAQINPGFGPTIFRFQYGATSAYGSQIYHGESIGADDLEHLVSGEISELTPGTTYHFRVVATNFSGSTFGPDQTFTTIDLPKVESAPVSQVGQTTAALNAEVDPSFSPTTYHFEYGPTAILWHQHSGKCVGRCKRRVSHR